MTSSFVERRIDVTFRLGKGDFGEAGFNVVKETGLRVRASITKNGSASMGVCHLQVYGMKLATMNKLSTLGLLPNGSRLNLVEVEAGDDEIGMTSVFKGLIQDAYVDLAGAPEVCLNVVSYEGGWEAIKPVSPTSFTGSVDVAVAIEQIAKKTRLGFENNGVSVQLHNAYYPGSARRQMYAAATAANINIVIDRDVVAIWPKGAARRNQILSLRADSGLKGYPSFTSNGVRLECLLLPFVEFGCSFQLTSSLVAANKVWVIQRLQYALESQSSGGAWFMVIDANQTEFASGRIQPR